MVRFDEDTILQTAGWIAETEPNRAAADKAVKRIGKVILQAERADSAPGPIVARVILRSRAVRMIAAAVVILSLGTLATVHLFTRPARPLVQGPQSAVNRTPADRDRQPAPEHTPVGPQQPAEDEQLTTELRRVEELFAARDVDGLVGVLQTGSWQGKMAAANYLAEIGDPRALPTLASLSERWTGDEADSRFVRAIDRIKAVQRREETAEGTEDPQSTETLTQAAHADPGAMNVVILEQDTRRPISGARVGRYISGKGGESHFTDENGCCRLEIGPERPEFLSIRVRRDGYVPMMFAWRDEMTRHIPAEFTMFLAKGTVIGGIVTNEDGEPIEDVSVKMSAREDESREQPWIAVRDSVQTDKNGKWVADTLPAELDEIYLTLSHPDYPDDRASRRSGREFTIAQLRARTAVMVMKYGVPVSGVVVDQAGNPISGAQVMQGRDRYNKDPKTKTDAHGRFEFANVYPDQTILTAMADGYGPDLKALEVRPGVRAVEFVLEPGYTILGRVVDASGAPVAEATVYSEEWRGCRILNWETTTDAEGRFMWYSAPPDEVKIQVRKDGYTRTPSVPLVPSDQEYQIILYDVLKIAGVVVDAATGEPVERLSLIPGVQWEEGERIVWQTQWERVFTGGKFDLDMKSGGTEYQIKVEADGYLRGLSRPFNIDDGPVHLEIALEKCQDLGGVVRLANGEPAAGAQVYVVKKDGRFRLENGMNPNERGSEHAEAGPDGLFSLKPQAEFFKLVVLHDEGFAEVAEGALRESEEIHLRRWGRVEGTIYTGPGPAPGTKIYLHHTTSRNDPEGLNYSCSYDVQTDERGHFTAERVMPGRMRLVRALEDDAGKPLSFTTLGEVEVPAGQTVYVTFGGGGRTVRGRLVVPEQMTEFQSWNSTVCTIRAKTTAPPIWAQTYEDIDLPRPQRFDEMTFAEGLQWSLRWAQSQEGQAVARAIEETMRPGDDRAESTYDPGIGTDGSFKVDDVQAGPYVLDVRAYQTRRYGRPSPMKLVGRVVHEFSVPHVDEWNIDEPLDLGAITLEPVKALDVGQLAPELEMEGLDGNKVRLSDYAGRFVLLHFWTLPWDSDADNRMEDVRRIRERFVDDERFDILGITTRGRIPLWPDLIRKYAEEDGLTWKQGFIAADSRDLDAYTARRRPWNVVVGPDGRVLASGLWGEELESALAAALGRE